MSDIMGNINEYKVVIKTSFRRGRVTKLGCHLLGDFIYKVGWRELIHNPFLFIWMCIEILSIRVRVEDV